MNNLQWLVYLGGIVAFSIGCYFYFSSKKNDFINSINWTTELEKLYKENTVKSLQVLLKEKGLSIVGSKKELVNRLYINK